VAEHIVHHLAVVWDESDHVSSKHSPQLAKGFWFGFSAAFPESNGAAESPGIIATNSPFFGPAKVTAFLHEGQFVPHTGKNKDLAIAKWCSTGLVDQDEHFRFVLDDLRQMRYSNGDPPMHANSAAMVTLVTSDWGSGMTEALNYVQTKAKSHRAYFSCVRLNKSLAQGKERMENAGYLLGQELRKLFVRIEKGAFVFEIKGNAG
jgi:hypothetical protein